MKPYLTETTPANVRRPISRAAVLAFALIASPLSAQQAPAARPDATTLARYDRNKNGVLDPDEVVAKDAAEKRAAAGVNAGPAGAAPAADEIVALSPFEVVADDKGYFASNTMSGTRLNSKIEDLGQSITVVTKEQMSDFAMLDINDIFDQLAGTEGTNSYSAFEVDRTGAVTDNVSLDPNNANRVRGIGSANIAFNNIATTGRVPVDPLWMDSLELSRGPNANIFGLGNSAGTVNQVPSTANLRRDFTKLELRGDSYDGWRASLDVNRMLLKNKLALRASYANQHTGFVRKPAGEDARRLSLQVKAQPFRNTTVALSWYNYKNASLRPNYTTPRDFITSWIAAGKPAWNPVTRLITLNGASYGQGAGGTLQAGSTTPITTLPTYFAANDARAVFRIGAAGETPYWSAPSNNTNATSPLLNVASTIRFLQTAAVNPTSANQPLFATSAALADKSVYDWSKVSLSSGKQWDDVNTYLAQVDQIVLNTPRHTLGRSGHVHARECQADCKPSHGRRERQRHSRPDLRRPQYRQSRRLAQSLFRPALPQELRALPAGTAVALGHHPGPARLSPQPREESGLDQVARHPAAPGVFRIQGPGEPPVFVSAYPHVAQHSLD